jgi:hypothetical protein
MKNIILFLVCLVPAVVVAQSYSVDWYKIAGGGGTSTNGQYAVSGTIGQPDAGNTMSGGNYSLTGGFWSLISVVQTAGAPTLYVSQSGNTVTVYWQPVTGGWNLQQNPDVGSTNWVQTTYFVSSIGSTNMISIPSPSGNLFFRLTHP